MKPTTWMMLAFIALGCEPRTIPEACIAVDEEIWQEGKLWCDGAFSFHDADCEAPDDGAIVCKPPDGGECPRCPLDEVDASLESSLRDVLTVKAPMCQLERWETSCMLTEDAGMSYAQESYCCYAVAYWGEDCGP